MNRVSKIKHAAVYALAIPRMVERAYIVTYVRPSVSVRLWDGVGNLHISFAGGTSVSFGNNSCLFDAFIIYYLLIPSI